MSKLMDYLRDDKEMQELRKEWKEKFGAASFPGFNYDEYGGIDCYKRKIQEGLVSGDPKGAHQKITKWDALEEFWGMEKEWEKRFDEPIPKFSFAEYGNGVRYREKIREALDAGDPKKAHIE